MEKTTQQQAGTHQRRVHRLLHCVELLRQLLEVKLETLYVFPSFLHTALQQSANKRAANDLMRLGETVVQHVSTLSSMVDHLGGDAQRDLLPRWSPPQEPVSAIVFQEELASKILSECELMLGGDWDASSHLRSWLQERVETIHKESRGHLAMIDRIFSRAKPAYRDLVVERFRVTAIP